MELNEECGEAEEGSDTAASALVNPLPGPQAGQEEAAEEEKNSCSYGGHP